MRNDFAVIIISHGNPYCETRSTIRACGYTGRIYVVADDEDETLEQYRNEYGDNLHVFHKEDWFDIGDNFDIGKNTAVYARNECLKVARSANLKYYLMLDDDLKDLSYRYVDDGHLKGKKVRNLDGLLESICEYYDESDVACIGFGIATDYIGGVDTFESGKLNRMVMNSFFMRTSNDILWNFRFTQDLITPMREALKGRVFFRFPNVQQTFDVWLGKRDSKKTSGNISSYRTLGSYVVRFYAVMNNPSCVKLKYKEGGFDYSVDQNCAYPKVISEGLRK